MCPIVGNLNYFFVWLFAHQLGFFYADGSLVKLGSKYFAAMAAGGLALLGLATAVRPYSSSMVGLVNERSNTNPPTICILLLTIWQVGLAMLLRAVVQPGAGTQQDLGEGHRPERNDHDYVPLAPDRRPDHRGSPVPNRLPSTRDRNPNLVGGTAPLGA